MSAIPAASVSLKTMADGTLRMTFDIEPAQAKDAFSLFAAPGTPVAIAALKSGYAAKSDMGNPITEKEPVGPLCKWLVLRCKEPEFWAWINSMLNFPHFRVSDEGAAKRWVCETLLITSRKEVDGHIVAESKFHELIRIPYQHWLVRRQG